MIFGHYEATLSHNVHRDTHNLNWLHTGLCGARKQVSEVDAWNMFRWTVFTIYMHALGKKNIQNRGTKT